MWTKARTISKIFAFQYTAARCSDFILLLLPKYFVSYTHCSTKKVNSKYTDTSKTQRQNTHIYTVSRKTSQLWQAVASSSMDWFW